jgi:prevent-host-death family protein
MRTATLTETKNNLSALIDLVRNGETIVILDRGRPVARIVSAVSGDVDVDGRLARLERQGALQRATAAPSREIFASRPKVKAGVSLLQALLAERSEAR